MQDKKISVIVPIYNVEEYLEECLRSIQTQDFDEFEAILVDDGSTDRSGTIAKEFATQDSRFKYFKKDNSGAGATRNFAVKQACGKYLTFVDSDDVIPHYAFSRMYSAAIEHDSDMVVGRVMRLRGEEYEASRMFDFTFSKYQAHTSLATNPLLHYDVIVCSKLIRKTFWDENEVQYPEHLSYCEDIPVAAKLYCNAKKIYMLDEIVYLWRIRQGGAQSTTQKQNVGMVRDRLNALRMINQEIKASGFGPEVEKQKK